MIFFVWVSKPIIFFWNAKHKKDACEFFNKTFFLQNVEQEEKTQRDKI